MWFQQIAETKGNIDLQPYKQTSLDLSMSLQNFRQAQAWDISKNETEWVERPHEEGAILVYSERPFLRFSLTAKRKPTFQAYLLLVPCIVLSLIATCSFTFPCERPDRISLGMYRLRVTYLILHSAYHLIEMWILVSTLNSNLVMGIFGAYVILLLLLTNTVPPSPASVPKLCMN